MRSAVSGRGQLFVHIHTDEAVQGLGIGQPSPGVRQVIEEGLKDLLIGQDPFDIEKLWNDMFWRVRGYGRKGVAFCALSAVDIGLWDLKAKALGLPLYKLLGPYAESVPVYGSGGWTNLSQDELVAEMVAGQAGRFDLMAEVPTQRFPGGAALRTPLLVAAMLWFSLRDRL